MAHTHTHTQMLTLPDVRYQAKLVKRPLLTQVVTTAILFGTGDVIAQQAVDKKGLEKHDLARTGRMVLYGGGESKLSLPLWRPLRGQRASCCALTTRK